MFKYYFFLSLFSLLLLNACSSSYEKISKNNYYPKEEFSKHLFEVYKKNASFEANEMHDWNSAKLYSEKALLAASGEKIKPEKLSYWKIPKDKMKELNIAYKNLMIIYNKAIDLDPYNLAVAISSFDCWAEQQEENWQTWDINKCKTSFLNSMQNIYKSIEDEKMLKDEKVNAEEIINDSVAVVTKDKEENILQLIYFDFDKSNLSIVSINKIRKFLKKYDDKIEKYLIVGHTDTKGSEEYNINLSINRANAVKNILIQNGVIENNIKIIGKGEKNLMIKTADEVPHPINRRAEIKPLN